LTILNLDYPALVKSMLPKPSPVYSDKVCGTGLHKQILHASCCDYFNPVDSVCKHIVPGIASSLTLLAMTEEADVPRNDEEWVIASRRQGNPEQKKRHCEPKAG